MNKKIVNVLNLQIQYDKEIESIVDGILFKYSEWIYKDSYGLIFHPMFPIPKISLTIRIIDSHYDELIYKEFKDIGVDINMTITLIDFDSINCHSSRHKGKVFKR